MVGQLGCRIEQVIRFDEAVPCELNAEDHFDVVGLTCMFESRTMLVPFTDSQTVGVLSILKDTLSFLVEALTQIYQRRSYMVTLYHHWITPSVFHWGLIQ